MFERFTCTTRKIDLESSLRDPVGCLHSRRRDRSRSRVAPAEHVTSSTSIEGLMTSSVLRTSLRGSSRMFVGWLLAVTVLGCSGHKEVTPDDCTELRDHIVELRLASLANIKSGSVLPGIGSGHQTSRPVPPVNIAAHRAALKQALGESFATTCLKQISVTQLKCALAATSSDSVNDCLKKNEVKE